MRVLLFVRVRLLSLVISIKSTDLRASQRRHLQAFTLAQSLIDIMLAGLDETDLTNIVIIIASTQQQRADSECAVLFQTTSSGAADVATRKFITYARDRNRETRGSYHSQDYTSVKRTTPAMFCES